MAMSAQRIGYGFAALLAGLLTGCFGEEWSGVVYPNKDDLTEQRYIGVFGSLEECRSAALAAIQAGALGAKADYECGLNCDGGLEPGSPMICEQTQH